MTTITIDLPDDLARRLAERAEAAKTSISELLVGAAERLFGDEAEEGWDPSLTPDDIAAIKDGAADAAAGRTRPWEEVRAEMQALVRR